MSSISSRYTELVLQGRKPGEKFMRFLPSVLSKEECVEWIAFAESHGFKPASLLSDDTSKNPHRSNDRVLVNDAKRSQERFSRISLALPPTWTDEQNYKWTLVGLNPRLSFLRYQTQERYGRHVDIAYEDSEAKQRSFITVQLYLNEEFTGGETRFMQETGYTDFQQRGHLDIIPKTGSELLFEHELEHEGCPVLKGRKYSLRVDVMYKQ